MLESLYGKDPNELTLVIDGVTVPVLSARLIRSMDTCADALTCVIPWEADFLELGFDRDITRVTTPYGYQDCAIYMGGELNMVGVLYNVMHRRGQDGTTKDLEIYSKTADIIDSTVVAPYEALNITLTDRCIQQCTPFGISVVVGDGVNLLKKKRVLIPQYAPSVTFVNAFSDDQIALAPTLTQYPISKIPAIDPAFYRKPKELILALEPKFARVAAKRTDTVFTHLSKLAKQRGCLLSCTKYGDLLITKANTTDKPIGEIAEGSSPLADVYEAKFNGRDRWAYYKAIAKSNKRLAASRSGVAQDEAVRAARLLTFDAPDDLPGESKNAAEWRKNKSAAEAMSISFPVNSWYGPNGKLWEPNTLVTVISPTIGIKFGFTFLIAKVEFKYENSGSTAVLDLKPPTVYSSGPMVEPWLETQKT